MAIFVGPVEKFGHPYYSQALQVITEIAKDILFHVFKFL